MKGSGDADRKLQQALASLASLSATEHLGPADDCPSTESLWMALHGEMTGEETRKIGLHTVECAACAELWRLAHQMRTDADLPIREPTPARRIGIGGWAAAAAVVVMIGASALMLRFPGSPRVPGPGTSTQRAPASETAIRSLVSIDSPLPRSAALLRWEGPADATFLVTVTTGDLQPLFSVQDLTTGQLLLDGDVLDELPEGTTLLWRIEARLPNGDRISRAFSSALADELRP